MVRDPHADDYGSEEYLEWLAMQAALAREASSGGDIAVLTAEVEAILARFKLPLVRSEALSVLGMAHEERGDFGQALSLYRQAHELSAPGSFRRYICECCGLASASEKLGDRVGARAWLVTALGTGIQMGRHSSHDVVKRLLDLVGDERELTEAEMKVCRAAVVHSFRAFDPEAPAGITIAKAIDLLSQLESGGR